MGWPLLAMLTLEAAACPEGPALSERTMCRAAEVVLVVAVGEGDAGASLVHRVFVAPDAPHQDTIGPMMFADILPAWPPGTHRLLVLQWYPGSSVMGERWVRVVDRPLPPDVRLGTLADQQHYYSLHCAQHRDDLDPVPAGWWTWWADDLYDGFPKGSATSIFGPQGPPPVLRTTSP